MSSKNNNNPENVKATGSSLDGINVDDKEDYSDLPESVSEEELDVSLQEAVKAHDKGKTKLSALPSSKQDVEFDKEKCCFSIGNCSRDWTTSNVHKHVALMSGMTPERVIKGGTGLFHIEFRTEDQATHAAHTKYTCGKVISMSGAALYYYRLNYRAEEIRSDHEERIIKAFKEELGLDVVSIKINEEKKCVSIYVPNYKWFSKLLRAPLGSSVQVKGIGAFNTTYWLHASRSCASSSDPDVGKLQISHIPAYYDEETLLMDISDVIAPIVPRSHILGLSIYQYPDSNRNAPFGFVHILGRESAELLERIEIPIPASKECIYFQRAVEKRKRDE